MCSLPHSFISFHAVLLCTLCKLTTRFNPNRLFKFSKWNTVLDIESSLHFFNECAVTMAVDETF